LLRAGQPPPRVALRAAGSLRAAAGLKKPAIAEEVATARHWGPKGRKRGVPSQVQAPPPGQQADPRARLPAREDSPRAGRPPGCSPAGPSPRGPGGLSGGAGAGPPRGPARQRARPGPGGAGRGPAALGGDGTAPTSVSLRADPPCAGGGAAEGREEALGPGPASAQSAAGGGRDHRASSPGAAVPALAAASRPERGPGVRVPPSRWGRPAGRLCRPPGPGLWSRLPTAHEVLAWCAAQRPKSPQPGVPSHGAGLNPVEIWGSSLSCKCRRRAARGRPQAGALSAPASSRPGRGPSHIRWHGRIQGNRSRFPLRSSI
jgi:hypothetical protein